MSVRAPFLFTAVLACVGVLAAATAASSRRPAVREDRHRFSWREGAGREQVQATCTRCHGLNLIAELVGLHEGWLAGPHRHDGEAAGGRPRDRSRPTWRRTTRSRTRRAPCCSPARRRSTIKEWLAPTLGSRPHDSHAAADGSIWWTGQYASKLGRLDPKTGQIREFDVPAKTPAARPGRGSAGQYLVHRHPEGRDRPARSTNRAGARVSDHRAWRTRAAHADHGWAPAADVLHAAVGPRRPHQPRHRRDRDQEDAERQHLPLRHPDQLAGRAVVRGLPRQPHRQRRSADDGDQGVSAAERRRPSAPADHHAGRRDLVHGLSRAACSGASIRRPGR